MIPIRVVVADDHAIVREGVRGVLDDTGTFDVVGEAGDVSEAVRLCETLHPDVLILDINMPGGSGLSAVSRIIRQAPGTRILILSVHDDIEYIRESRRAGAHGYLRKDSAPAELRAAVQAVHAGGSFYSDAIATRLNDSSADPGDDSQSDLLTPREREVLIGVAQGLANKEIAARLGISRRTVEAHRDSLTRKLRIRTVAGLTRYCIRHGLVIG